MTPRLIPLCLSLLPGVIMSMDILPNNTHVKLGVVVDDVWVSNYGISSQQIQEAISSAAATADEELFTNGQIEIEFIGADQDPADYGADMTAFLTMVDCMTTHNISAELDHYSVLHIALTDLGCQRLEEESSLMIPMVEGRQAMVQLLADLRYAKTLTWQTFTVFYDDSVSESLADSIHEVLSRNTAVAMLKVRGSGDIRNLLSDIPVRKSGNRFMVLTRKNVVEEFISTAKSQNLLAVKNAWLYVVTDTNSQDADMSSFISMGQDGCNMAFVFDTSLGQGEECQTGLLCIVKELVKFIAIGFQDTLVEENKSFSLVLSVEEWLIVKPSDRERVNNVKDRMNDLLSSSGDCNKCTRWRMQAVEVMENNAINQLEVGSWIISRGLDLKDDLFPHVTGGFRGRMIPVASLEYAPWMTYVRDGKGNIQYSGLIFAMLDYIGERLNFTYRVLEPADGLWGTYQNGEWNGMIKQLVENEVMIAAASFAISDERQQAVNLSIPIDFQPYSFMYRQPKEISRAGIFIKPFNPFVWLCVAVTQVLIGPIIWFIHRSSYYYVYTDSVTEFGFFDLSNVVLFCYGAMVQQGGSGVPEANSGRLAVGFWLLFTTIIIVSYSGNLFAFLFSPQIEFPTKDLDHILQKGQDEGITWGVLGGSVIEQYLQNSDEVKFQNLAIGAQKHTSQETVADGNLYSLIKENEHVYIEWLSKLEMMRKEQYRITGLCDYAIGQEQFFFERVGMAFPKNSPWVDYFNTEIKLIFERGLIGRWKQQFWPQEDECSVTAASDGSMPQITITDLQGAFIILLFGLVFSGCILFCEKMYFKNRKQDKKSSSKPFVVVA